jgi:hypothetical protein
MLARALPCASKVHSRALRDLYADLERNNMAHKVWESIRRLALEFDKELPTRAKLRLLVKDLDAASPESAERDLQEVRYLHYSLNELLTLAERSNGRQS